MKWMLFLLTLTIFSCSEKKETDQSGKLPERENQVSKEKISDQENLALIGWLDYYLKDNPNFAKERFMLTNTSPINYSPSNVTVMNEKGFNEIYKPFFVFNESKTKYLDFDSYHWFPNPDGTASFKADQQVALVNYTDKTVEQIAFLGPSYTIEEAYWKGDSVTVLLGNSYEKVPFMMKYNFTKNKVEHFQYADTLTFKTPYSKFRLRKFGVKVE